MKKLRIGIVALGRVASATHIPVLRTLEDVEVVTGADNNPERAQRVKELFGLKSVYSSYEEMYSSEQLDGVYICLPNFMHEDACRKALESGINVLCEKPMGMSVEESSSVTALAERKGLILMPGYKKRYAPNFKKAKDIINGGILGKIVHVQATFLTAGPYIGWDPKSDWYLDEKWNGVIYDVGCHIVDMLLYLVPGKPESVRTVGLNGFTGYETPTNFSTSCLINGEILVNLTVGWRLAADNISLAIHGTAGTLYVSRDDLTYVNPGTDPVDVFLRHTTNAYREAMGILSKVANKIRGNNFYMEDLMQARAFCSAIRGDLAPPINGEDATNVHVFLEKITDSIRQ